MANKAMGIGKDSVLQWFDTNAANPYFSVWLGRQILFQNNDDDFEKALRLLDENIAAAAANGFNDVMILKLHPKPDKSGFVTDKSPVCASYTFRPKDLDPLIGTIQPYNNNNYNEQRLQALEQKIDLLLNEDEEEVEQPQQSDAMGSIINNLLNNEQMQAALIGLLSNVITKFSAPKNNLNQQTMGIAGLSEEDKIKQAIDTLKLHDDNLADDLILLADMAQSNPQQFKFLLTMLRK